MWSNFLMRKFKTSRDRRLNKSVKFEKYSVEYNKFNLEDFRAALGASGKMEKTFHEGKEFYPAWGELHQDLWDALYKYKPFMFDENDMDMRYLLNTGVMKAIQESPHYKELRQLTKLDLMGTTVGAEALSEEVKNLVEELKDQYEEALKELEDAQQQADSAEQALEGEESEESRKGGTADKEDKKKWALKEAQKRLEEAKKKMGKVIDKKAKGKINRFTNAATAKTRETTDMITAWGLEQSDTFTQSGYQEKMQLLDRLRDNPKLKRIAELAGRYKRMAFAIQKQQIKHGTDAIHNVVLGDDLGRILPSEAMKLNHPILKNLFKLALLEKKVLQYEYMGKERIAKGAIIVCVDSSGSMNGTPEVWSKSVALGMVEIAKIQKRDVFVIHFDASPKESLHTNYFPKDGSWGLEEVLDMAEYYSGGGTYFEPPLDLSRDKIMEQEQFSKADIIFVTDGESTVTDEWLKDFKSWKKEKNVRIYSILINTYRGTTVSLDLFSDKAFSLSDINEKQMDDTAFKLFDLI
jgi:uncharacterized protein with von Willebrand factor type A (vWA) domain